MATILREDDFEVGMLVTGHSSDQLIFQNNEARYDRSYNGRIYRLEAIDLPYIAIKEVRPNFLGGGNAYCTSVHTLAVDAVFAEAGTQMVDIRHFRFMRVNKEMAQAILGLDFQKIT